MSIFEFWRDKNYIIHTLYDWKKEADVSGVYQADETDRVVLEFVEKLVEKFFDEEEQRNNEEHCPKPGDEERFKKESENAHNLREGKGE